MERISTGSEDGCVNQAAVDAVLLVDVYVPIHFITDTKWNTTK